MIYYLISLLVLVAPILIFIGKATNLILYLLIILLVMLTCESSNKKKWIIISCILSIVLNNIFKASNLMDKYSGILDYKSTINYAISLIVLLGVLDICKEKKLINKVYYICKSYRNVLILEIIVGQLMIMYYLLTGIGFRFIADMKVFTGTYVEPHPFGYSLIIMVIITTFLKETEKDFKLMVGLKFLYIVPCISMFLTGARSLTIAYLLFMLGSIYSINKDKSKRESLFNIINMSIMIMGFIIFFGYIVDFVVTSTFVQRFIQTTQGGNITNGRDIFWIQLLDTYIYDIGVFDKLCGSGIYSTKIYNLKNYGMAIWAHSDFIDILISYGLLMSSLVVKKYLEYFRMIIISNNKGRGIFMVLGIIFLLLSNGVINYPFFFISFIYIKLAQYSCEISCQEVINEVTSLS